MKLLIIKYHLPSFLTSTTTQHHRQSKRPTSKYSALTRLSSSPTPSSSRRRCTSWQWTRLSWRRSRGSWTRGGGRRRRSSRVSKWWVFSLKSTYMCLSVLCLLCLLIFLTCLYVLYAHLPALMKTSIIHVHLSPDCLPTTGCLVFCLPKFNKAYSHHSICGATKQK